MGYRVGQEKGPVRLILESPGTPISDGGNFGPRANWSQSPAGGMARQPVSGDRRAVALFVPRCGGCLLQPVETSCASDVSSTPRVACLLRVPGIGARSNSP